MQDHELQAREGVCAGGAGEKEEKRDFFFIRVGEAAGLSRIQSGLNPVFDPLCSWSTSHPLS